MALDTVGAANDAGQPLDDTLPTDTLGDTTTTASTPASPGNTVGAGVDTTPGGQQLSYIDQLIQAKADAANKGQTVGSGPNQTAFVTNGHITGMGAKIIAAAEQLLGTQYKWGGNGPGGVDCSGLVRWAYQQAGITLPRISYQQANAGKRVALKNLRPGDLVAWDDSARNPGADHIAIYLGNGQIIEAAHPGTNVRIRKLGSWSADATAWGVTGLW